MDDLIKTMAAKFHVGNSANLNILQLRLLIPEKIEFNFSVVGGFRIMIIVFFKATMISWDS